MSDEDGGSQPPMESGKRVQERMDFEGFLFEFELIMTGVLAEGRMPVYENMMNAEVHMLWSRMSDERKKEWAELRKMIDPMDEDRMNKNRIEGKQILLTVIKEDLGILFTPKKIGYIRHGVAKLWDLYPAYQSVPSDKLTKEK